jgi:mannose-6-phosphate isomerase-like protein (cupin superfamily)
MKRVLLFVLSIIMAAAATGAAQRRAATPTGRVTFAVTVADPSGKPISGVKVTMTGPVHRSSSTEAGRLVFENLPAGTYHFRFQRDGFVAVEKYVAGRGSAPIAVKVALLPMEPPAKPIAPVGALPPFTPSMSKFVVLDMPAFIEKNYVGRASGKTTPLGCSPGASSTLIQINEGIPTHTHADADEFIYVVAGEGSVNMTNRQESLGPGVFLMIPRGLAHGFTIGRKKPLVMISTRAGDKCAG